MKETKMQAKVTFRKLIQDSQEYGSNDEHIVSREFFDLEIGGKRHSDLYVDIKQPVGSDFETAPLEVGPPHDHRAGLLITMPFATRRKNTTDPRLVHRVVVSAQER